MRAVGVHGPSTALRLGKGSGFGLAAVFAVVLFLGRGIAKAESEGPRELSLSQALELALGTNPELRVESLTSALSEEDVSRSRSIYDTLLTTSFSGTGSQLKTGSGVTKNGASSIGLSQLLPTGATVSLTTQTAFLSLYPPIPGSPAYDFSSAVTAYLSQPLQRNFGREATEAGITLAKSAHEDALERFRLTATDTLLAVATAYNRLYTLRQAREARKRSLDLALALAEDTRAKVEQGIAKAVDLADAEYGAAQRLKDTVDAERNVRDQEAILRYLTGLPPGPELVPIDAPTRQEPEGNEEGTVKRALARRPDLIQLRSALETSRFQERLARNQTLPQVSLVLGAGLLGTGGTLADNLRQMGNGRSWWSGGIQFTASLGNVAAQSDYRKARLRTEQVKMQIDALSLRVRDDVASDMRALISARLQIRLAEDALQQAEQRFAEYRRNREAGTAKTQDVISADTDLSNAVGSRLDAAESYAAAVLKLWRDTGELLERLEIDVDLSRPGELMRKHDSGAEGQAPGPVEPEQPKARARRGAAQQAEGEVDALRAASRLSRAFERMLDGKKRPAGAGEPGPVEAGPPIPPPPPECGSELLLAVRLNGEPVSDGTVFRRSGEELLLPAEEAGAWRLLVPEHAARFCDGERYVSLQAFAGVAARLEPENQSVALEVAPVALAPTRLGSPAPPPAAAQLGRGFFLDYDLNAQRQSGDIWDLGGVAQAVFFHPSGVLESGLLARRRPGEGELIRLDTVWSHDDPAAARTLRVGDSTTRPGLLGGWTRFGGLQIASNYGLQPGFSIHPQPAPLAGVAEGASVVDVLVDGARRASARVPQGPFEIRDLPSVSGRGDVAVVVRDALGRERVLVQSYYLTPALLRSGLSEYAFGAGVRREEYGFESGRYTGLLASALYRRGLSESLTGELRAEWDDNALKVEAGGSSLLGLAGVGTLAFGLSSGRGGPGAELVAAYEYGTSWASIGGSYLRATPSFREFGASGGEPALASRWTVGGGLTFPRYGSPSVSYTSQRRWGQPSASLLTAGYSITFGRVTLGAQALRDLAPEGFYALTASCSVLLDPRRTASAAVRAFRGETRVGAELQQAVPGDRRGIGFRLATEGGAGPSLREAELHLRGDNADGTLAYSKIDGYEAVRGDAAGSLVWMDGVLRPSRAVGPGFILAELPGYPGVTVFADNRRVGRTDGKGFLIVPQARPYERNTIGFDPEELPLAARIDSAREEAIPARRAGAHVRFRVAARSAVVAHLVRVDGRPLPPGTLLRDPGGRQWPVASLGLAYLDDLEPGLLSLEAGLENGVCRVELEIPFAPDDIPDLGEVTCR